MREGPDEMTPKPQEKPQPRDLSQQQAEAVIALLPESPPLYGPDELTDKPLRFLCAELVREAAFDLVE